jgi:YD repeat-containing protein
MFLILCFGFATVTWGQEARPDPPASSPTTTGKTDGKTDGTPQDRKDQAAAKKDPRPLISDMTDPMRVIWPKRATQPGETGQDQPTPTSVLRLVPGLGGDALNDLVESEVDLSPDVRMMLRYSRNPANAARFRAAVAPHRWRDPSVLFSTRGVRKWSEREQRDELGRITSMTDSLGNRTDIKYDDRGFAGAESDPAGPLNPRWGNAGRLIQRNPQRNSYQERPIFDYTPWEQRARKGARLEVSPFANRTESNLNPRTGARSFTSYDLTGRPIYRYDGKGRLSFNRYGPGGQLLGTYDSTGRLTLFGHDRLGRRNFSADSVGNRMLVDQERGNAVMRTGDGRVIRTNSMTSPIPTTGTFGQGFPKNLSEAQRHELYKTNKNRKTAKEREEEASKDRK